MHMLDEWRTRKLGCWKGPVYYINIPKAMVEELDWQRGDSIIVGTVRGSGELLLKKSPGNWYVCGPLYGSEGR